MARRILDTLAVLSLLLCALTLLLWVSGLLAPHVFAWHALQARTGKLQYEYGRLGWNSGGVIAEWDILEFARLDRPFNAAELAQARICYSGLLPFEQEPWDGSDLTQLQLKPQPLCGSMPWFGDDRRAIRRVVVSYCALLLGSGVAPLCWLIQRRADRWRESLRRCAEGPRVRAARCRRCGYDLRATRNRCPECGTVTDRWTRA